MSLHADLKEITDDRPGIWLDIRYATSNNFTEAPVYDKPRCVLQKDAFEAFGKAHELAFRMGYGIRIFDAFRPTEAQQKLWNHTPDPEFLAPPERGSPHSRGVAIDLTLTDMNGNDLDMGTGFDAFTPLSHHRVTDGISHEAQHNRLTLLGIMTLAGWDFYRNEWWHYQLFDSRTYPLFSDQEAGTGMMAA